eukprot:4190259-Amphidinium_carterae.1
MAKIRHVGNIKQELCLEDILLEMGLVRQRCLRKSGWHLHQWKRPHVQLQFIPKDSLHPGSSLIQSDAPQAYLQASFRPELPTFVSLPPEWLPHKIRSKFCSPVFPLRAPLYGQPLSGNMWGDHLAQK